MWGDLKEARWIMAKGGLFLLAGVLASGLLLVEIPTLRAVVLLGLAVWCFCRAYYFAFYVIELTSTTGSSTRGCGQRWCIWYFGRGSERHGARRRFPSSYEKKEPAASAVPLTHRWERA